MLRNKIQSAVGLMQDVSDEKIDGAFAALSLCGIALRV